MPFFPSLSKCILTALVLCGALAIPSFAASPVSMTGSIVNVMVGANFKGGGTKIVNGKTVYLEGTPLLIITIRSSSASVRFQLPMNSARAEASMDLAMHAAATGQQVLVKYSVSENSVPWQSCWDMDADGCIALGGLGYASVFHSLWVVQ